ncbi:alpha/beta hydrolase [Sandaracinus amylolyticus]|uniref:6-hexanolactone hydrolase n=1 Tax=Sandaracinus amylolyticus TaxID=927083 RepID=A0A0F6SG26_9BACT|nr:alpha/beta hydrolase [Sandaracinus amylolyticus]AKF07959.1 6-hexanolactone hydrolase [Sandaracinus amylolyticus]
MPSPALEQLIAQLRALRPPDLETRGLDPLQVRRALETFSAAVTPGLDVREVDLMRDLAPDDPRYDDEDAVFMPAEWVVPRGADVTQRLVYLHGGGYVAGSPRTHRGLVTRIARAANMVALVPDYRLAPEHRFPAALEDARVALAHAFDHGPDGEQPATRVVLAGDSAGGGLVISTLVAARDAGERLPARAATLSAWADLEACGESVVSRAGVDPMLPASLLKGWCRHYLGDIDPRHPLASPIHADLRGLPPLLLQVGDAEVLLDDSVRLAARAKEAGVEVTLEVFDDLFHVFQAFAGALPEGRAAIATIGAFLRA